MTRRPTREGGRGEGGFTLVEVAVAAVAAGLVVAVALAAYLVAARALTRWDRARALDDDLRLATTLLHADLDRALAAERPAPDSLVLTLRAPGPLGTAPPAAAPLTGRRPPVAVTYALRDSTLRRDGVPVHEAPVRAVRFEVGEALAESAHAGEGPRTPLVVRLTFAAGDRDEAREVVHAWRTPAPWPAP